MPVGIIDKRNIPILVGLGKSTIGGFFVHNSVDEFAVCRKDDHRNREIIELHIRALIQDIHGQSLSCAPSLCCSICFSGVNTRSIQCSDIEIQALRRDLVAVNKPFQFVWQLIIGAKRNIFLGCAARQKSRLGRSHHRVKDFGGVSHFRDHCLHAFGVECPNFVCRVHYK